MNPVTHFEIPAKDTKRATRFYEDVFEWKMTDIPEMQYTIVHTTEVDEQNMPKDTGAINGGMMTQEQNGGANPVLVVKVSSIDTASKKIESAGGKIVTPKVRVGDMGYYARFTDTEDVVMGLWEDIKAA